MDWNRIIKPYNCVIVANGSFPSAALPLRMLAEAKMVIACDGAAESFFRMGIQPDVIIGDIDSLSDKLQNLWKDRIRKNPDQETNDLSKAVQYAVWKGEREVLILGATGRREDHTVGNIALLSDYASLFKRVEMLTDYGLFTPLTHNTTLESFPGQQVSLFALTPLIQVTVEGLKYPIDRLKLSKWWYGTLNEATGSEFTVRFSRPGKFLAYRTMTMGND